MVNFFELLGDEAPAKAQKPKPPRATSDNVDKLANANASKQIHAGADKENQKGNNNQKANGKPSDKQQQGGGAKQQLNGNAKSSAAADKGHNRPPKQAREPKDPGAPAHEAPYPAKQTRDPIERAKFGGEAGKGPIKQKQERHNGSKTAHVVKDEKRHGGGAGNWGNEERDIHLLEHGSVDAAEKAVREIEKAGKDGEAKAVGSEKPAAKELSAEEKAEQEAKKAQADLESRQKTLDQYYKDLKKKVLSTASQEVRKVADLSLDKKVQVFKKDEDTVLFSQLEKGNAETSKAVKKGKSKPKKQLLEYEAKFADEYARSDQQRPRYSRENSNNNSANNSGGRPRSGGAPSGSRGGRGGSNNYNQTRDQQQQKSTAPVPKLNDKQAFPALA